MSWFAEFLAHPGPIIITFLFKVFVVIFGFFFLVAVAFWTLRVIVIITSPLWGTALLLLCIATYPISVLLRLCGYNARSLFGIIATFMTNYGRSRRSTVEADPGVKFEHQTGSGTHHSERAKKDRAQHTGTGQGDKADSLNSKEPDPYTLLGVTKASSKEEVTKAYRLKMAQNHPDKVASLDPALQNFATERAKIISEAYSAIVEKL